MTILNWIIEFLGKIKLIYILLKTLLKNRWNNMMLTFFIRYTEAHGFQAVHHAE